MAAIISGNVPRLASSYSLRRPFLSTKSHSILPNPSFFVGSIRYSSTADIMATIYFEPSGCNCANRTEYDKAAINAAATQALQLASDGTQIGRDKYPHVYNDFEKFQFDHAQKPYIEFPIMPDGQPYDGESSPGADRIVLGSIATDFASAVYCAVITHDGQRKNGFVECKDDTVNQDGQGTFDVNRTEGRGREPGPGRQLLEKLFIN